MGGLGLVDWPGPSWGEGRLSSSLAVTLWSRVKTASWDVLAPGSYSQGLGMEP